MLHFDQGDITRFAARMTRLTMFADPNNPVLVAAMTDLMESWERIMEEGNRKGVLAGTDKDGISAPPLLYRPVGGVRKLTVAQRLGQRPNLKRGKYAGTGSSPGILPNNNLSTSEYRHLAGPRLAPRKQFSRVITNAATGHGRDPDNPYAWFAELAWIDVVNVKGEHFLHYHFDGDGQAKYDLRGVRPADVEKLRDSLRSWAKLVIRGNYGE